MTTNFTNCNRSGKPRPEIIEISSEDEDDNSEPTIEPTPIPTLSEYLGQTYRIFYGNEYHPNYDRRLCKFVSYPVHVPVIDDDGDDLSDDECRLVIDEEAGKFEFVINVKVLFDEGEDAAVPTEMNFTVEAESETVRLMHQINAILYEDEKIIEGEDSPREE